MSYTLNGSRVLASQGDTCSAGLESDRPVQADLSGLGILEGVQCSNWSGNLSWPDRVLGAEWGRKEVLREVQGPKGEGQNR